MAITMQTIPEYHTPKTFIISKSISDTNQESIEIFKPFDYKGQRKKLRKTQGLNWFTIFLMFFSLAIIGGLLWGTFAWIASINGIFWRVAIGVLGIGLSLGVTFLALLLYAYTYPTERDKTFVAREEASKRLVKLSQDLQTDWRHMAVPKDENFRIGILTTRTGVVIVDYKNNKGWNIKKEQVSKIITNPDHSFTSNNNVVQLFTQETKDTSYKIPPRELVFVLKSDQPAQIRIRFMDHFYDAENFATECKLGWQMN